MSINAFLFVVFVVIFIFGLVLYVVDYSKVCRRSVLGSSIIRDRVVDQRSDRLRFREP